MNLSLSESLENFIYVNNIIPHDFCDKIVEDIKKNYVWEGHTWYDPNKGIYKHKDKELDVTWLKNNHKEEYYNILKKPLQEYHHKHALIENNRFNIITKVSSPRVNKYQPGTLMRLHFDNIHSLFDGNEKGVPCLSMVSVLNNEFQGGELVIRDKAYDLRKGDLIIFPSAFLYPHKVNEIKQGIRYGIVCWGY